MTANLREIREAMGTKLSEMGAFRGQIFHYIPGTFEPPGCIIVPGTFVPGDTKAAIQYDRTFGRGSNDYIFTLMIAVSAVEDRETAKKLDDFLAVDGPKSVKAKLEEDETLNGLVSFIKVDRVIQYGKCDWNNLRFFGAHLIVEVSA